MTHNLESSATYMDVMLRSTNRGPFVPIYFEDIHKSHWLRMKSLKTS